MFVSNDSSAASTKKERASWLWSIALPAIYLLFSWKKILGVSAFLIFCSHLAGMVLPIGMEMERRGDGHIDKVTKNENDVNWGLTFGQCAVKVFKVNDNYEIFSLN